MAPPGGLLLADACTVRANVHAERSMLGNVPRNQVVHARTEVCLTDASRRS